MTIALCFLTIGDLTQPAMWETLLANGGAANVYCHPKHPETVSTGFLKAGIIAERVATEHGRASLVDATLNLFRAAFADPRNEYFVLLSESTIPIMTFAEVRRELAARPGTSVISYRIPKPGSEHFERQKKLAPGCAFTPFFEHDQWVILSRRHVAQLLEKPLLACFGRMFAADEHYFLNVLAHHCGVKPAEIHNARRTFVNWHERQVKEVKDDTGRVVKRTVHPKTYDALTAGELRAARDAGCWFFRKVSASCDCSGLTNFVS